MSTNLDKPLPHSTAPWDARFGFFWYNDQEIFRDRQDDLDRKAAWFAETGINHVITASCTHFRWSFRRYWDLLTETLARIVRACHKHGICVTEHHSAHLTFNPLTADEEEYMDRILRRRQSDRASWPHLRADCDADPVITGDIRLSQLRQIDGRTGRWARSSYHGWCLCFNNPHYRRAYLDYLATLYETGIDGIMTDDVQWFGQGHACACGRCQRLFGERNGFELPPAGEAWRAWHGNLDNASYRAWLDFRLRSNEDFHEAVKQHYEGLGLRLLRPNYVSSPLGFNWTGYTLERAPHLDWVFQECCFSDIIRYNWPYFAVHAAYLRTVGRRRGIPALNMFYPDRPDAERFCWALTTSWGMGYMATPEGRTLNFEEKRLHAFEKRHARLLRAPKSIARIGFYASRRVRELQGDFRGLVTWMRACYMHNVPFDMFQEEDLAQLSKYSVAVVYNHVFISAEQLQAFAEFLRSGGTLVWVGRSGTCDWNGNPRHSEELARCWGLAAFSWKEKGQASEMREVGRGKLVLVAPDFGLGRIEERYISDRFMIPPARIPYSPMQRNDELSRNKVVELLASLPAAPPDLELENVPLGVMVSMFRSTDGSALVLHLVNASGTLNSPPDGKVGHEDIIPFPSHAGRSKMTLRLRKPLDLSGHQVRMAHLFDLERVEPWPVDWSEKGERILISVEPERVTDYALIEIEFQ